MGEAPGKQICKCSGEVKNNIQGSLPLLWMPNYS